MSMKAVLQLFCQCQTFLICTHVNPDPDALAAQVVLGMYLEQQGKKVFLISEKDVPENFLFLPGMKKIKPLGRRRKIKYDVAIVVDAGDISRVGHVSRIFDPEKPIINIDHHVTNTRFGMINYVVEDASSTSEVIFGILIKSGAALSEEMAILLYVGAMTDTGSFRYSNTSAKTHRMIAALMQFPIRADEFYRKIYEQVPLLDIKYFTKMISQFSSLYDDQLICVELPRRIVRKFSTQFDLRHKIFDYLRTIEGVRVLVIFTEEGRNLTRVNFRSQSDVDVSRIASKFNGGGHSKASGCTLSGDIKSARRKVLPEIRKLLV